MPSRQFDVSPPGRDSVTQQRTAAAAPARGGPRKSTSVNGVAWDRCEREADQLAARVLQRAPDSGVLRSSERPSNVAFDGGTGLTGRLAARHGGGRPIPDGARDPLENAFGTDFSSVRVHTDAEAGRP